MELELVLDREPEVLATKSVAPAGCELGPARVPELRLLGAVVVREAVALEVQDVIVDTIKGNNKEPTLRNLHTRTKLGIL